MPGTVKPGGVLAGIKVLDLSWGVAGPMAAMLLGDHGAEVTKIDPPQGDPFADFSGYTVWNRRKLRMPLDLSDAGDRDRFIALAAEADVVVESLSPGSAHRLGVAYEQLHARNPRLIYCSITGYGSTGGLRDRPGYDALVAARTGQMWEARGVPGGMLNRLAGTADPLADLEPPEGCWVGAPRPGPLFGGLPWVSLGAFYLAVLGISAALRARELTGRGQHVETSLLQGAMATAVWPWQRVEHPDATGFQSWVIDPRAPKGFFRCADGQWIHQWVPLPSFVLTAAEDGLKPSPDLTSPRQASVRIGLDPNDMVMLHHYVPLMAEAVARFPSDDWAALAAAVDVPLQPVRSPEEALDDERFLADGCVVALPHPDLGLVRQVGVAYRLSACPSPIESADVTVGPSTNVTVREPVGGLTAGDPPLAGLLVLDLGLAAAGPFGAQLLADLGANVIKVHQRHDGYWMSNHIGMGCNRGKRSIALDLKTEDGRAVLYDLVRRADVVHHNMRASAAEKLGVDYPTLAAINPRLIYCHTRGFEHGERDGLPGNDQTAAALAGIEWLDGGLDDRGRPLWAVTSLGDTGNGFLSAIAVVQAILHRDRTGEGQFVDTSIMYAHLLNASFAWKAADGAASGARPRLDALQLGWGPLYRLYATADDWICVAAVTEEHWRALCRAVDRPQLVDDDRFATPADRAACAQELTAVLENVMSTLPAAELARRLEDAGVPCELTHELRARELFDDPDLRAKGWIATYTHPVVGTMEVAGRLVDLSENPSVLPGPPPLVGQHTREILSELGYTEDRIGALVAGGAVIVCGGESELQR